MEVAAGLIADGLVTGWFQGRREWGPRALGNRSILANPAVPSMKDTTNAKIKRCESFRPFAPSVLKEAVATYFEQTVDSPFMQHVVKNGCAVFGALGAEQSTSVAMTAFRALLVTLSIVAHGAERQVHA